MAPIFSLGENNFQAKEIIFRLPVSDCYQSFLNPKISKEIFKTILYTCPVILINKTGRFL